MIKRIRFEKLKNTRDLGGFTTKYNKKIKSGVLFRSGALSKASVNDINLLINGFGIKTVIDLRTDVEIADSPDPFIDNIKYIKCSLLDDSFLGIARDEYSIDSWLNIFNNNMSGPKDIYSDMYQKLVFDKHVASCFNLIFNTIADAEGPVLWHCSAGKDRVGVTTALLLSILGVSREHIIKDYLMTEYFTFPEIAKVTIFGSLKYHNIKISRNIRILMGVRASYINRIFDRIYKDYYDIDDFIIKNYNIDKSVLDKIRSKYLV